MLTLDEREEFFRYLRSKEIATNKKSQKTIKIEKKEDKNNQKQTLKDEKDYTGEH